MWEHLPRTGVTPTAPGLPRQTLPAETRAVVFPEDTLLGQGCPQHRNTESGLCCPSGSQAGPGTEVGNGGRAMESSLLPPGHSSWALPAAQEGNIYECHGSLAEAAGLILSVGIPAR